MNLYKSEFFRINGYFVNLVVVASSPSEANELAKSENMKIEGIKAEAIDYILCNEWLEWSPAGQLSVSVCEKDYEDYIGVSLWEQKNGSWELQKNDSGYVETLKF